MDRLVGSGHRTAISAALMLLPPLAVEMLRETRWFCGSDPVFAGLHRYCAADDGRTYRQTAHVVYPQHLIDRPLGERITTVVLPVVEEPWVIIHELGHVLHAFLGFPPAPEPVTEYATCSDWEAFAEGFTAAHVPGYAASDAVDRRLATFRNRYPAVGAHFASAARA